MSIIGAYVVPHPPLIVPEVGRGSEEQIIKTTKAYQEVAKEIAKLNPDTIVFTSPHNVLYSDYFHISPNKNAQGNFKSFGAAEVEFNEIYDEELVKEIEKISKERDFPAGTRGEQDPSLDHGTMVPLYFIRKELPNCNIVRIGLSGLALVKHYEFGQIIKEAIENLNRRVVFVASGDLSHKLQTYGPYGFVEEGPIYDKRIMDVLGNAKFNELFEFSDEFLEKSAECGHRSFTILAGALDKEDIDAKALSHEDVTGVGYGICSFIPKGENLNRNFRDKYLEKEQERINKKRHSDNDYIKLAYMTIDKIVKEDKVLEVPNNISKELLEEKSAMFTSIHEFDKLRGCVGTFIPTQDNIAEELINSSINASVRDFRFPKITEEELPYIDVSVYKLFPPELVEDKEMLDPKKYGIIVSSEYKRGLLLPDLPGIDTIDEQITIARRKGNILPDEDITIERFLVEKYD